MERRKFPRVAIIIPALNEELNIERTIQEITLRNAVIVVVDNGSTDRTAEMATAAGVQVIYEPRKGYGYACLAGINYLKTEVQPDLVVFLDADGSDDPREIERLLRLKTHKSSPDIILGSRIERMRAGSLSSHALIANKVFTKIINLVYRTNLTDMGPLRIMDFQTLLDIDMQDTGYGWTSEMIVKALKKGYTIGEIPVVYRQRLGESKISGSLVTSLRAAVWITYHIFKHMI